MWPLYSHALAKQPKVKKLLKIAHQIYQVFGSGSHNSLYPQFMKYATAFNNGCNLGLLCSTDIRMSFYFYYIIRCLFQRSALLSTIYTPIWVSARKTDRVRKAVLDIKSSQTWKSLYILIRALFPCLQVLCLDDTNRLGMRKYYFLSNRIDATNLRSARDQDDNDIFPAPSGVECKKILSEDDYLDKEVEEE